jgi:hypothetical protein
VPCHVTHQRRPHDCALLCCSFALRVLTTRPPPRGSSVHAAVDDRMTVRGGVHRDAVLGGTESLLLVKSSFEAPESYELSMPARSGRAFLLADFLDHGPVTSEKMDEPASSDASTLTRTDSSESTAASSSSSGGHSESLTFGEDSHPLSVAEESGLQAQFAERTAMEMAQIVAYWTERAAAVAAADATSDVEGRWSLPSPEECYPENSLLTVNSSDDDDETRFDSDCEIECDADGDDDDDGLGRWDDVVLSTCIRGAPRQQERLRHHAPIPSGGLRRRQSRAAASSHPIELGHGLDEVCERYVPTRSRVNPAATPHGHCQRLALHVAALLWFSATILLWDENGRLVQAAMRGVLHTFILLARGCLWLLEATLRAIS